MKLFSIQTFLCLFVFSGFLHGAAKLRLSATTAGPVSIVQGQNGAVQTIDAGNFGDGSLNLSATTLSTWITPTIGQPHGCSLNGTCTPVNLRLDTASLAKGIYTGIVTVTDPNATDAPQTITVTVQIGGGVPDKVEMFLPPDGRTVKQPFQTNARLTTNVGSPGNGPKLSLAMAAAGSFDFAFSYTVEASAAPGIPEMDFTGSLFIQSTFAPDNKNVPVTLHVTSKPIASLLPSSISFRAAQGTTKIDKWLIVSNAGLGALNLTGVTVSGVTGSWLSAVITNGIVVATADPKGLAPGVYTGKLAVASNAVNPISVDVRLDVEAVKPPTVLTGGVVDNVAGEPTLALGGIVSIYGDQLITGDAVQETVLPLKTTLGGARVFLNDQPIPVYTATGSHVLNATGQINAIIPYEARVGDGILRVERDGVRGNNVSVKIARSVPKIMRLGIANYGIIVNSDGSFPIPATAGISSHPAAPGDALTIYALGFGPTDPAVPSGAGAPGQEPLARVPGGFKVYFGGSGFTLPAGVDPLYIGLAPGFVGLYQINAVVPAGAPKGSEVSVTISNDAIISSRVNIAIQ